MSNLDYLKIKIARATREENFKAVIAYAKAAGKEAMKEARKCEKLKRVMSCIVF